MISRDEFFRLLVSCLNSDFDSDSNTLKIKLNSQLSWETIKDFKLTILQMLGNFNVPLPIKDPENHLLESKFKIDANLINVDEDTIQINKYAQLFVNNSSIIETLTKNEDYLNYIVEKIYEMFTTNNFDEIKEGVLNQVTDKIIIPEIDQQIIDKILATLNIDTIVNDKVNQVINDYKTQVNNIIKNLQKQIDDLYQQLENTIMIN